MDCTRFRSSFAPATESPELLEHLRTCDGCLDFAIQADPDVMFRALGGEDLLPPGGLDAFVTEVMSEVRVRGAETIVERSEPAWYRRLAVAAALTVAVSAGSLFVLEQSRPVMPMPVTRAVLQPAAPTMNRPVIETYESQNATIVEVPTEGAGDVKVVMIFDETLPADL
jgi:hypothetical protein